MDVYKKITIIRYIILNNIYDKRLILLANEISVFTVQALQSPTKRKHYNKTLKLQVATNFWHFNQHEQLKIDYFIWLQIKLC